MDLSTLLVLCAVDAFLMAGLGACVARLRDRPPIEGALLGFVFGPFGVLVEGLLPARSRGYSAVHDLQLDGPAAGPPVLSGEPDDEAARAFLNRLGGA
jgi:hypothetical protein